MKYRTIPVAVDAVQWMGEQDICRILNWLAQQKTNLNGWLFHATNISIPTAAGLARAQPTDWIIRDAQGRYSVCTTEFFKTLYEEVKL